MRRIVKGGALANCVMLAAVQAAAQSATPVRHIDLGASGDILYDSNVARASADQAAVRGLEREDMRFTPAITVDALFPIGRQSISVIGSGGYDFYARNSRLNRERISLDTALGLRLANCDVSLQGDYARRQSDLGDIGFTGTDPDNRVSNVEEVKTIGASGTCGGRVGFKPVASIARTWTDNNTDVRKFSDVNVTAIEGGVAYARPTFGLLTLFGNYRDTSFPNRILVLGNDDVDGFTLKGGGLRFERRIGSKLRGLVEIAYVSVDPARSAVAGFSGPTWRGELTATLGSRLQINGRASRSIESSNRVDANYFVERQYSLDTAYAFGSRLSLRGGGVRRNRDFRGAGSTFGPALVQDRTDTLFSSLEFKQSARFTFTLDYTHENRAANGTFYDYTSDRAGVGVRTKF